MRRDEDRLLFKQIKKGNKKAFDSLFRKYYAQMVRFAMGYLHDGPVAEGVVQDVFIRIWEHAKNIEIETSLSAYIYRATRNQCLNLIKHEAVKRKYEQEQLGEATETYQGGPGSINADKFKGALSLAVGKLPNKCREIFELAKFEGLSYDEIANYLKVSAKTVENQMGIALRKLREYLSPELEEIFE